MSRLNYCTAPRSIIPVRKEAAPMLRKLYRAWRFYIGLNYPWRLAWHKALREKAR